MPSKVTDLEPPTALPLRWVSALLAPGRSVVHRLFGLRLMAGTLGGVDWVCRRRSQPAGAHGVCVNLRNDLECLGVSGDLSRQH